MPKDGRKLFSHHADSRRKAFEMLRLQRELLLSCLEGEGKPWAPILNGPLRKDCNVCYSNIIDLSLCAEFQLLSLLISSTNLLWKGESLYLALLGSWSLYVQWDNLEDFHYFHCSLGLHSPRKGTETKNWGPKVWAVILRSTGRGEGNWNKEGKEANAMCVNEKVTAVGQAGCSPTGASRKLCRLCDQSCPTRTLTSRSIYHQLLPAILWGSCAGMVNFPTFCPVHMGPNALAARENL